MTRRRHALVLAALAAAVLAAAGPAYGDGAPSLFVEANRDYDACNYEAAIAKYEQLARGTRYPTLEYNLGNAYFRSAQPRRAKDEKCRFGPPRLGLAILHYERALAFDRDFEDAAYNLDVAREQVAALYGQDKVKDAASEPPWIRVATWLPLGTLSWLFLALDAAFFALLIVLRFLPSGFLRTGLMVGDVFVGLAGVAFGVLLGLHAYYLETVHPGVIVADEVIMRDGPDEATQEGPKLHAGQRALVLREDHGWRRIRLANGLEKWVPRESVDEIW